MKQCILFLTVLLALSMATPLHAPGLFDIIRAYEEGAAAGRQADIEQEQIELMRLEREQRQIELDRLRQKVRQVQEQKAREEKEAREKKALLERRKKAFEYFEANVKPKVVKVHPDFDEIVRNPKYWEWARAQRPALRFAAEDSPDPEDIIWALGEFKKSNQLNVNPDFIKSPSMKRKEK